MAKVTRGEFLGLGSLFASGIAAGQTPYSSSSGCSISRASSATGTGAP